MCPARIPYYRQPYPAQKTLPEQALQNPWQSLICGSFWPGGHWAWGRISERLLRQDWVALKELKLSYHNGYI